MLRPRRARDLDGCVAMLREVHDADRYPAIWPADPAAWLRGNDRLAAWVAQDDGRLLGHLSLHATDASRARSQWCEALGVPVECLAVVSRFFVSTRARRRGVGAALMDRAEEHAAAHDLRLVLDVAAHNRSAIAFYERRGWRAVGTAELELSADPWTLRVALFVLDNDG
ncbi:MAG TPA: GNAT family N-acetyltransferase [Solirubrobacteraceae bacterium]|nr:GNAT family N-acetyltransferase [Solirubrobacteraceae bacterium]